MGHAGRHLEGTQRCTDAAVGSILKQAGYMYVYVTFPTFHFFKRDKPHMHAQFSQDLRLFTSCCSAGNPPAPLYQSALYARPVIAAEPLPPT
jgi:hypothetical protein